MDLSIVTTLYNSAPYLDEFYARIKAVAEQVAETFEIIFVNDGSPDNSLNIAISLADSDERIRVVDLSRNFGHHKAMMTGLSFASGQKVFLIDSDLEENPELLETFTRIFDESNGADVVYGVQTRRKGGLFERFTGALFYKLFNFLSNYPIPENLLTVRLMSKRYVESLLRHRESEVTIAGLWEITGFRQIPIEVVKHDKGSSSYGIKSKANLFVNAISSFSSKPLVYIFYLGFLVSSIATLYVLFLIIRKLVFGISVPGYTSLIVSLWLLGGVIILSLGIVGIYISKVFIEVKRRPYTIVRSVYERGKETERSEDWEPLQ